LLVVIDLDPLLLVPFAIDAMNNGKPPDSAVDPYHSEIINSAAVSKDTGLLLALFAVGLLIGSPILGYLGNHGISMKQKYHHLPLLIYFVINQPIE
jgi:MFS family permease